MATHNREKRGRGATKSKESSGTGDICGKGRYNNSRAGRRNIHIPKDKLVQALPGAIRAATKTATPGRTGASVRSHYKG